ncbi:hypothetical protein MLD38_018869 [Melastoma candidum]|uniref:Uncharacterized protein n=1 Tax=Melastoma candidum TaxID=119954 RepID=A0ACB9QVQ5_9MYRT|nr:hypothetical protein MLD38_018869 [Melastoma candidum]
MTSSPPNSSFHWQYTELDDHNFRIQGRNLFYAVVLFALVLLFSLLFFYARWLCRCLDYPGPLPLPPPPSRPEHGLSKSAIDALPIVLHQVGGRVGEDTECIICLGELEEGEKVKVLPPCEHRFHGECVDRWLLARTACPLCRTKVGVRSLDLEAAIV